MQTSKARTTADVPQRSSPTTPKTNRKVRTVNADSESVSSPNKSSRTPKERSPRVVDRRSPRSPTIEKKRPAKMPELEAQRAQLQEELKKAKDQLSSSEASKKKAHLEAEEVKKQLAAMSEQVEESQKQLSELSDSDKARLQELRKISHDRDQAWKSELEALQKQHELDSTALASANAEIQKLKNQLESKMVAPPIQAESANAEALEELSKVQLELEESKKRVSCLEEFVGKLQLSGRGQADNYLEKEDNEEAIDFMALKTEASQLRAALEEAERRNEEQYIQSTLQIRSAYEQMEKTKLELKASRADVEALKEKLTEMEASIRSVNEGLDFSQTDGKPIESDLGRENMSVPDLEAELDSITQENEKLKSEIKKRNEEIASVEEAKAGEREALARLGYMKEEAERSSRKAIYVTEQLDAAQTANGELETEMRRLKVQSDQWRKAAEAATAMLSTAGNHNAKYVGRTGSMDYHHTIGGRLGSPFSEEADDDSPKKKNGNNMLKKIGVLLKKSPK
ncbi:unnamed protein product [Cuscuta europaea]|uniref:Interactor of constitutive active ROPs 2, chloroplastic-like n=1 Tax=Cuscuta europaea TaxID=41803 RepID=A0A9P0ZA14_CUSEU|nr:unnamed protein product [Cuscuta europaea]